MRASFQREMDMAESQLAFLASVGSISPYVGLFGTVWGIMHAFTGLASLQQVTLAVVAPGIAEALVATAIGLFAAIPAVLAYNRFSHDVDRIAIKLAGFNCDLSKWIERIVFENADTAIWGELVFDVLDGGIMFGSGDVVKHIGDDYDVDFVSKGKWRPRFVVIVGAVSESLVSNFGFFQGVF